PKTEDKQETELEWDGDDKETSDEEYHQLLDEFSSAEDEEAEQLRKFAKEVKRGRKAKKLGLHASEIKEKAVDELDDSDGETERWKSLENRFDKKAAVPIFSLGMAFRGNSQFNKALVKYGLKTSRHLVFVKDEANRVRATCSWKGCKWLIYGSKTSKRDNKLVTSNGIAKQYYNEIKDNPTWKVELIKKAMLRDMCADVSISKCKRAKSLVLKAALDSMQGEYSRVYDYQMELLRSNPGSTVVVCLDPEFEEKVFERMYVCFDACKKGFLSGCRMVIELDGCWFKGATNVATKTYDSWYWFLGLLQKDLNINNGGQGWVIISDQQKKHTDKELQKKWWCCAKSPCRELFNYHRTVLAQETPEGAQDMMKTSPEHWSRAFFKLGSNCDLVDNNMCESFNNSIMDARFYPVISMHETIRKKVMVRIQENRARSERWVGTICPNIFKKLKINIQRSSKVLDDFIAPCFTISEYMKTYDHVLLPVEGPGNWPISDMPRPKAPTYVKMLGRPKTERRMKVGEAPKGTKLSKVGTKIKYRLCGKFDHNARTCHKNA
ncbi:hypothetical protein U9M48_014362, partial [Paspalum notatum var. saurae]